MNSLFLANADVHQVIANIPDITITPAFLVVAAQGHATPAEIQTVRDEIVAANTELQQYALTRGIPVVDMFKFADTIVPLYPWTFGGHTYQTAFTGNGFDILTQPEGILSNAIAMAFDLGYGQNLPIFSDQQIVTTSGFAPDSATTYFDVRSLVIVPEPSTLWLGLVGLASALTFVARKPARPEDMKNK